MHLAVCDDHIADRKQMERLLGRESDRRIPTTGVLYVDSYGSERSILVTPMIYDAIFMDMTEDGCDAIRLAGKLRENGTLIPIVFCCGKVNYRNAEHLPDNVLFLDKPIQVAALTEMIDQLLVIVQNRVRKLEFRNRTDTFYITEEELLYATVYDDRQMLLHLSNGEERLTEMSLESFCSNLSDCESYILLANHSILNMSYIEEVSFFKVTMNDGRHFRLAPGESHSLKKALDAYQKDISGSKS